MKWFLEAAVYNVLTRVPRGDPIHHLLQRRVAKSFPIHDDRFARELRYADAHLSTLPRSTDDLSSVRALEFGTGRHLTVAMRLLSMGVASVRAVDVSRLAKPDLIRDSASRLGSASLSSVVTARDPIAVLRELGCDYRTTPPGSFVDVADDSVDLVLSTSVLEHVPRGELHELLAECRRVLRPGGRLSCIVDYKDHYSYSDPSLHRLNFLAVPEKRWFRWCSPAMHFQSRIRHDELAAHVEAAGFDVSTAYVLDPTKEDLDWLASADLDPCFSDMDARRLGIGEAHLVGVVRGQS